MYSTDNKELHPIPERIDVSTLRNMVLTDPVALIQLAREKNTKAGSGISYASQQDLHVVGPYHEGQNLIIAANSGDISMNEKPTIDELNSGAESTTLSEGDRNDCAILYPHSSEGDVFVYEEHPEESPNHGYNSRLLEIVSEGYDSIGIPLAKERQAVNSMSHFLASEKPPTIAPHVISPRVLGHDNWQANLHMGVYTKSGIQSMCKREQIPTPPTLNYLLTKDFAEVAEELQYTFPSYDELVISMQSGCSGEGVFFEPKTYEAIKKRLQASFESGEMVSIQGRIPKEMILNSPCLRAYIGDNEIITTGVTIQRLVNGRYSGNIWYRGIEDDLATLAPDYFDVSQRTLQLLQQYGVRGKINNDTMLISEQGRDYFDLPGNTLHRETNVRPAFSDPTGRIIRDGVINRLPVAQIQTNFGISIPDRLYYQQNLLEILNAHAGTDVSVFLGLRYPSSYAPEPGRSYVIFAANERVSKNELDHIHAETQALIEKY